MAGLLSTANADARVLSILKDVELSHVEAVLELQKLDVDTSETSVRRARRGLDVRKIEGPQVAVVIGDFQIGAHDERFIEKLIEITKDIKPDVIISTGDELDVTSLGRWVRGLPDEFECSFQDELDAWFDIATGFNEVAPNATKRMCRSNHTDRLPNSLASRLPGLRDLRALQLPALLRLDELGWIYDEEPTEFLPGVVYSHGDEFGVTAKGQANKVDQVIKTRQAHIVFGHSHQAGLYTSALGFAYEMDTKWALNVGAGMRFDKATYVKSTSPNWSRGIGVITYENGCAHPELALEVNGVIRYNGVSYK